MKKETNNILNWNVEGKICFGSKQWLFLSNFSPFFLTDSWVTFSQQKENVEKA